MHIRRHRVEFISLFAAAVEWRDTGQACHGSSSLPAPVVFVVSVLKTRSRQRKTPTCRNTTAALHMPSHALWERTRPVSPENGPTHSCFLAALNSDKETKSWNLKAFFDDLYVKLSSFSLKEYTRKRRARYLSIQIRYNVHKRLNNVHKRLTEARFRFVTMTSTNCI